jgi:hypothetical protein
VHAAGAALEAGSPLDYGGWYELMVLAGQFYLGVGVVLVVGVTTVTTVRLVKEGNGELTAVKTLQSSAAKWRIALVSNNMARNLRWRAASALCDGGCRQFEAFKNSRASLITPPKRRIHQKFTVEGLIRSDR